MLLAENTANMLVFSQVYCSFCDALGGAALFGMSRLQGGCKGGGGTLAQLNTNLDAPGSIQNDCSARFAHLLQNKQRQQPALGSRGSSSSQ